MTAPLTVRLESPTVDGTLKYVVTLDGGSDTPKFIVSEGATEEAARYAAAQRLRALVMLLEEHRNALDGWIGTNYEEWTMTPISHQW